MPESAVAGFGFVLLVIAAFFTSFYSWRLMFLTFHGEPRAPRETMSHVHESPNVMLVPLYLLALGAVAAQNAIRARAVRGATHVGARARGGGSGRRPRQGGAHNQQCTENFSDPSISHGSDSSRGHGKEGQGGCPERTASG